ncbi:hypothetical protein JTE90_022840 [Oedothorax gibbosus]|uniref:Uncharacterized protein n=1 Tax=Oedothorax gibbosus TaxID=931172 RepID=A0AAV6TNW0_9ARAC|nr:hypothetical protein JTE90_022840 [Oedothorax gibbosus]
MIEDLRGSKSGGLNKIPDNKMKKVMDHINSFPRYISHYCRRDTQSHYLGAELNLQKIYNLYENTMKENELPVSFSTYKKHFYANFNLRFQKPKKDTCLKCDKFNAQIKGLTGEVADSLREEHSNHTQKAETLRDQMKKDLESAKENPELETNI